MPVWILTPTGINVLQRIIMERWKSNLYTIWLTQIISLMSFNFGVPFMSYYMQDLGVTNPSDVKMYV